MDVSLLFRYIEVVLREAWQRKFLCLLGFAVVSFAVLVVGMAWPSKFETSATIFADNQNILRPLLSNQAAQTNIQDQSRIVREKILSPSILTRVVERVYGANHFDSADALGQEINKLRNRLKIEGLGSSYIKISYSDSTADAAYRVINAVVDVFIKSSSEDQRSESREAFLFIDNQVKQYKDQLVQAEERLKQFRSAGFDGRDGDVNTRISTLRSQIEELKISIDEDRIAIASLEKQLANESEFSSARQQTDAFSLRLAELESTLSNMLLTYTEDYPDVISIKSQIQDLKKKILEADASKRGTSVAPVASGEAAVLNPLYQELRSRLSQTRTAMQSKEKRMIALNGMMEQENARGVRVAERAAEEAELTRDYNVTMRIYEDMLERKERARLSMTLNVEGQGVTYRVQEPALPPLHPVGLRFMHFVALGPVAGILFVVGLLVLYVLVDQRIRFPDRLHTLGVPVLAVVPHIHTPFTKRMVRMDMVLYIFLSLLVLAAYAGLAFASKLGYI